MILSADPHEIWLPIKIWKISSLAPLRATFVLRAQPILANFVHRFYAAYVDQQGDWNLEETSLRIILFLRDTASNLI